MIRFLMNADNNKHSRKFRNRQMSGGGQRHSTQHSVYSNCSLNYVNATQHMNCSLSCHLCWNVFFPADTYERARHSAPALKYLTWPEYCVIVSWNAMFTANLRCTVCQVSFIMQCRFRRVALCDVIMHCMKVKVISILLLHHFWPTTWEA